MGGDKNVTIKDVAKAAKVSVATASRAMNGVGRISPDTKALILKIASDLKYVPHIGARSLITRRTRVIGVLLPDLYGEFFSELVRGIDNAVRKGGYNILLSTYHNDEHESKVAIATMRGRVDGLVAMMPFQSDDEEIDAILNAPIVKIANPTNLDILPVVAIDNYAGGRLAVEHLYKKNRRQIAHMSGPTANIDAQERLRGYRDAIKHFGLEPIVFNGDFGEFTGYNYAIKIAEEVKSKNIDAIFVGNDTMGVGLIRGLLELGIKIPQDIAIIGFDNIPIANYITPSLSSLGVNMTELGEHAIELLSQMIAKKENYSKVASFKPHIYLRQSSI